MLSFFVWWNASIFNYHRIVLESFLKTKQARLYVPVGNGALSQATQIENFRILPCNKTAFLPIFPGYTLDVLFLFEQFFLRKAFSLDGVSDINIFLNYNKT